MKDNLKNYFDENDESSPPRIMGPLAHFNGWQFGLWRKWKGKTPNIIAREMAEEFLRQFPQAKYFLETTKADETYKFFLAAGNNTWDQLDYGIKLLARLFDPNMSYIYYWNKMRDLAKACRGDFSSAQRRQVYRKEVQGVSFEQARPIEQIDHCYLCWRGVPRRKGTRSHVYCPLHSSLDPSEYRRRKGMLNKIIGTGNKVDVLYSERLQSKSSLFAPYKKLPTYRSIRNKNGSIKKIASTITWDEIWFSHPDQIINRMPYVSDFLATKSVDITSTKTIIDALERTQNAIAREDELLALEQFYYDASLWFDSYYERLILAEIWLELEATTKHGGKRPRAGRKPKC